MTSNITSPDGAGTLTRSDPGPLAAFMRLLAHELGNPVASIRMSSEMLVGDIAPDMREQLSQLILDEAIRLELLIESAVYYTAIANPNVMQLEIEPFLRSVIQQAEAAMPVNVENEADVRSIQADSTQLARVMRELIANAIEAGATAIRVALRNDDDELVVTVGDDGEGLDSYRLSKAFEPFYTTREGKLGLGLSIARKIVELHGGSIEVESTTPTGSMVTFRIPINLPE